MKRIFGSTLGLTVLLAVCGIACDQPKINCTTGHGGFAMKYTLKAGSMTGTGDCDKLKGEIVGLEKYNPQKMGDPAHQDLTKATLAIRTSKLGQLAADDAADAGVSDTAHSLDSIGDFTSTDPNDKDLCFVPTLSPAEQNLPSPDNRNLLTDIKYEWSNIRVYATTASPGTQVVGEMKYTKDGCSASYTVIGLYPAVGCEAKDDKGNGTGMPDPTLCDAQANPDAGHATGSGINPDLKARVACDPDLLLCVLTAPPDALR